MKTKIIGILLLSLFLVMGCTSQTSQTDGHGTENAFEISPESLSEKLLEKESFILLDVREDFEFAEEHIENSANPTLLLSVNEISEKSLEALELKKDDEIVLYCRSGKRSAKAYELMTSLGYTNIKTLAGGLVHWKEDRFPVASGEYAEQVMQKNQAVNGPKIVFDETSINLGEVSKAVGLATTTFKVMNAGTEDLVIGDISTSCGCTSAELSEKNILPGDEATLTVSFDPNFHDEPLGKFSRTVFIESNDLFFPEAEVKIVVEEVVE